MLSNKQNTIRPTVRIEQNTRIRACSRRRWRHRCRNCHHTQFPTGGCSRFPDVLIGHFLRQVELIPLYKWTLTTTELTEILLLSPCHNLR